MNSQTLEPEDIRKMLRKNILIKGKQLTKRSLNAIIAKFWRLDAFNSILERWKVLDCLIAFLNERQDLKFTRYEFYHYFVLKEFESLSIDELNVIRKIALTFEELQVNDLEKQDFTKIAESLEATHIISKIEGVFLEYKEAETTKVSFIHHTLQEFLAVEEILENPDCFSNLEDYLFIKTPDGSVFRPSWGSTVRFLLESKESSLVFNLLMEKGESNPNLLNDDLANALTNFDTSKLEDKDRERIFLLIYKTYQSRKVWFPEWVDLSGFINSSHFDLLRDDIKSSTNLQDTYIRRANVVDVLGDVLKNKLATITKVEREFWLEQLVSFANDDNESSVLQRRSLVILPGFKNKAIISKVGDLSQNRDQMIREEYMRMCSRLAPNAKDTIDLCVATTKKGSSVTARSCLHKINNKVGITNLIDRFVTDKVFLKKFLEDEDIFIRPSHRSDKILIGLIKRHLQSLLPKLKELLWSIGSIDELYNERSLFLDDIANIVKDIDSEFLHQTFEKIDNKSSDAETKYYIAFGYASLFAHLADLENIDEIYEYLQTTSAPSPIFQDVIRGASVYEHGKGLFDHSVAKGYFTISDNSEEYKIKEETRKLDQFKKLLEPKKGKYSPKVFNFYIENEELLNTKAEKEDLIRLNSLVFETGLEKFDPKEMRVSINWDEFDGGVKSYSTSQSASYYGDIISVALKLDKQRLLKYRQNIIDFIPFAYSEEQTKIREVIHEIDDSELSFVNDLYLDQVSDKKDRRYLLPSSYTYLIGRYLKDGLKLTSSIPIFKSFILDDKIEGWVRRESLQNLGLILNNSKNTKSYLNGLFTKFLVSGIKEERELAVVANGLLINICKDSEAIRWRLSQLSERKFQFEKVEGFHVVTENEEELHSKNFARPIIELRSTKFINEFIELLDQTVQWQGSAYKDYRWYIWNSIIEFLSKLDLENFLDVVRSFQDWADRNPEQEDISWFHKKLADLHTLKVNKKKSIEDILEEIKISPSNSKISWESDLKGPLKLHRFLKATASDNQVTSRISENDKQFLVDVGILESSVLALKSDFQTNLFKNFNEESAIEQFSNYITQKLVAHLKSNIEEERLIWELIRTGHIHINELELQSSNTLQFFVNFNFLEKSQDDTFAFDRSISYFFTSFGEQLRIKQNATISRDKRLFVEDQYTQIYKIAWLKLRGISCDKDNFEKLFDANCKFVIDSIQGQGYPGLGQLMNSTNMSNNVIGLFDFDEAFNTFKKLGSVWGNIEGDIRTCLVKERRNKESFYALMLPVPKYRDKYVIQGEDALDLSGKMTVEHLISDKDLNIIMQTEFVSQIGGGKIIRLKENKATSWIKYFRLDKKCFKGFIPLYQKIHELFDLEPFSKK